jgi:hypothetical protein
MICTRSSALLIWTSRQEVLHSNPVVSEQAFKPCGIGEEERMVADLSFIEEWIPDQMEPGTVFVLENAGDMGEARNPYWAVLACPACGSLGLITRHQYSGLEAMICGGSECSAEYFLRDGVVRYRRPN